MNISATRSLLHSKILLFYHTEYKVTIWVGSHNLTAFSIEGINMEASISIECTIHDDIYREVLENLNYIKDQLCVRFNPKHIEIYKKLQSKAAEKTTNSLKLENAIKLVGKEMGNFKNNDIIQLLSLNDKQLAEFKEIRKSFFIYTYDITTREISLYRCIVEQAGKLDEYNDKLDIDFIEPRRFAYIGIGQFSFLNDQMKITKDILNVAHYFVNISIKYKVPNFIAFKKPSEEELSYWQINTNNHYTKTSTSDSIIQIATFDSTIPHNSPTLADDWGRFGEGFLNFHSQLFKLIRQELQIRERLDKKGNSSVDLNNSLKDFLEEAKHDKNLPPYSNSLIKMIIEELKI